MSKVCVVYPTESLVDEFGAFFEGKVGTCIIDGDMATTAIVHRSELESVTAGLDCVPSSGGLVRLMTLSDELEAYRRIREEASNLALVSRPLLPVGFYKPQALWFGVFHISVEVGCLRIKVGHGLASALGLRDGDGFSMGVSGDRNTLAFCYDPHGSPLLGGDLTASYALGVGLPRDFEAIAPGKWVPVAVEVRDQVVFVRLEDFFTSVREASPEDNNIDPEPSPEHPLPDTIHPLMLSIYWCACWLTAISPIR